MTPLSYDVRKRPDETLSGSPARARDDVRPAYMSNGSLSVNVHTQLTDVGGYNPFGYPCRGSLVEHRPTNSATTTTNPFGSFGQDNKTPHRCDEVTELLQLALTSNVVIVTEQQQNANWIEAQVIKHFVEAANHYSVTGSTPARASSWVNMRDEPGDVSFPPWLDNVQPQKLCESEKPLGQAQSVVASGCDPRRTVVVVLEMDVNSLNVRASAIEDACSCIAIAYPEYSISKKWKAEQWAWNMAEADVHVMQPKTLLNAIALSYVKISDIDLVVMHDCGDAEALVTYSTILSKFYFKGASSASPRLLGFVTTKHRSPPPIESDSFFDSESQESGHSCGPLCVVETVGYHPGEGTISSQLLSPFAAALQVLIREAPLFGGMDRYVERILKTLGPIGVDILWTITVEEIERTLGLSSSPASGVVRDEGVDLSLQYFHVIHSKNVESNTALQLIISRDKYAEIPVERKKTSANDIASQLSPKARRLFELVHYYLNIGAGFTVAIIMDEVAAAGVVTRFIRHNPQFSNWRCSTVPPAGDLAGSAPRSQADQLGILTFMKECTNTNPFELSTPNIFVGLKGSEDSPDIVKCDVVIHYYCGSQDSVSVEPVSGALNISLVPSAPWECSRDAELPPPKTAMLRRKDGTQNYDRKFKWLRNVHRALKKWFMIYVVDSLGVAELVFADDKLESAPQSAGPATQTQSNQPEMLAESAIGQPQKDPTSARPTILQSPSWASSDLYKGKSSTKYQLSQQSSKLFVARRPKQAKINKCPTAPAAAATQDGAVRPSADDSNALVGAVSEVALYTSPAELDNEYFEQDNRPDVTLVLPQKCDTVGHARAQVLTKIDGEDAITDPEVHEKTIYINGASGTELTFLTSVSMFNRYIQCLMPVNGEKPKFEFEAYPSGNGYVGYVVIPNNGNPIKAYSPEMRNKSLAKRAACFVAIRYLCEIGELNGEFVPYSKLIPKSDAPSNALLRTRRSASFSQTSIRCLDEIFGMKEEAVIPARAPTAPSAIDETKLADKTTLGSSIVYMRDSTQDAADLAQSSRIPSLVASHEQPETKKRAGDKLIPVSIPRTLEVASQVPTWPAKFYTYVMTLQRYPEFPGTELLMLVRCPLPDGFSIPLAVGNDIRWITPKFNMVVHLLESSVTALCKYTCTVLSLLINKSFGADPNTVNMLFSPCKRDPAKREEAHIDLNAALLLMKGDVNLQDVPPESWHMYKGRVAWDHLQRGRVIFITDILYGTDPTATFEELLELSQVPSAVDDNGGPGCRGEASPDELSGWIERAVGSTRDISEFKHAQGKRHFREASTIAGLLANAPYHVPVKEFKMFLHAPLYRTAKYSPQLDYTAFNPAYLEYSVLHGQPLPKLQKKPTPRSGFASPLLCTVKQFDLVHLGNLSMIPSFIFRCHSMLLVHEFKQEFSVPADVELLRTALTASGAQADTNYERLEALGDSVLKFVVTAILFALHPDADEGQLTDARVKIVSNRHLARVARQNRLDRYIWAHKFLPKQWLPPTNAWWHINPQYEKGRQYSEQTMQNVSNKMYADLVESILGACYLSSGVQGALAFIRRIKLMNEPQISDWQSIDDVWRAGLGRALGGPAPRVELEPDMVSGIERIFGYKFEDQCILGAACRHPSFTEAAKAPPGGDNNERHPLKALQDYQSLEFLGDSVIDLFVLEHYYNFVPALDPGQITLVKHISVSNDVLALIAAQNGLDKYIAYSSQELTEVIEKYRSHIRRLVEIHQRERDGYDRDTSMEWLDLPKECWYKLHTPKFLGDVIEAVFGAIAVDSKWDFGTLRAVFDRLILPFISKFVVPGEISIHPIIRAQIYLQKMGCSCFGYTYAAHTESGDKQSVDADGNGDENTIFVACSSSSSSKDESIEALFDGVHNLDSDNGEDLSQICYFKIHNQTMAQGTGHDRRRARYNAANEFVKKWEDPNIDGEAILVSAKCDCLNFTPEKEKELEIILGPADVLPVTDSDSTADAAANDSRVGTAASTSDRANSLRKSLTHFHGRSGDSAIDLWERVTNETPADLDVADTREMAMDTLEHPSIKRLKPNHSAS